MRVWCFCLVFFLGGTMWLRADEAGLAVLPEGRTFHRAVVIDGKIVLLGGNGEEGVNRAIDVYDFGLGEWAQRELPFEPITILLPVVVDGAVYVLEPSMRQFRRYEFEADRWEDLAAPTVERGNATLVGYGGKVYLIGGYADGVTRENCVEVYDPETGKWEIGPSLPGFEATDHFHLAAVLGDELHVVGHYFMGKDHWVYDGAEWSERAPAPVECGWKSAALEAVGGKLYLIQGLPGEGGESGVFVYEPKADRWERAGPVPEGVPMALFANVSIGDAIYLMGGMPEARNVFRYVVNRGEWEESGE